MVNLILTFNDSGFDAFTAPVFSPGAVSGITPGTEPGPGLIVGRREDARVVCRDG